MKTLYEILEVSETASNEVIEKAYKVLAKKYHPDLQQPENRELAEKKMKEINEAYDILSNEQRRKEYDDELFRNREAEKQRKNAANTKQAQQASTNIYTQNIPTMKQNEDYDKVNDMKRRRYEERLRKDEQEMRKQMQENLEQEYQNAYYNYLRSLGYKIKERWTWKKTKQLLIILAVLVIVITILWFFPPSHNMLVNIYQSNPIIKAVVDIVVNLVKSVFEAIQSIFTG